MSNATKSLSDHLLSLGWTDPTLCARGAGVVRGPKGGPALVIEPMRKRGPALDLKAALPPGARVTVGGETGVVDYSPRGYVRLSAAQEHDSPTALLSSLLEMGATIEIADAV